MCVHHAPLTPLCVCVCVCVCCLLAVGGMELSISLENKDREQIRALLQKMADTSTV